MHVVEERTSARRIGGSSGGRFEFVQRIAPDSPEGVSTSL
jgi:hypothetical protein